MAEHADVPLEQVAAVRAICVGLPEAHEEPAWVGTRWRIRSKTFAHMVRIDSGWPPAYARAAASDGPITTLTFRSVSPELDVLRAADHPFFAPPWRPDEVGLLLEAEVDWQEVAELLTESYCLQAPQKLAAAVERPNG